MEVQKLQVIHHDIDTLSETSGLNNHSNDVAERLGETCMLKSTRNNTCRTSNGGSKWNTDQAREVGGSLSNIIQGVVLENGNDDVSPTFHFLGAWKSDLLDQCLHECLSDIKM